MRKFIHSLLIIGMMIPISMFGQDYSTMWKQVEKAADADLPKTAMTELEKIVKKATKEQQYGHLLKAQLMHSQLMVTVAPDSLKPALARLEAQAVQTERKNPALAAVYNNILGKIYENQYIGDNDRTDRQPQSKVFFKKSLSNPKILAFHKAGEFSPLVETGVDSRFFDNDLLSVLGYQAGDFKTLHDYYHSVGNRPATLLTALRMLSSQNRAYRMYTDNRKSLGISAASEKKTLNPYLVALDSLIEEYKDLEMCGEAAIERYDFLSKCPDATDDQKVDFLEQALAKWGTWKRMNVLRNARAAMAQPAFYAEIEKSVMRKDEDFVVKLKSIRNVGRLTMRISKVNITGDNPIDINDEKTFAEVKKKMLSGTTKEYKRDYSHLKDYEKTNDSITVGGLPLGAYLVEIITERNNPTPKRRLLYISDLHLVSQALPGNATRYVVVNSTTGQPIAGAKINIKESDDYKRPSHNYTLTCDAKGEVTDKRENEKFYYKTIYPYTDNDRCFLRTNHGWNSFDFNKDTGVTQRGNIYTDRSIYRPGQTVHATILAFANKDRWETKALKGKTLTLKLRDANYKTIKEMQIVTDEYGTASADFPLPASGLTGTFMLQCETISANASVQVEEYKRPTFLIEFDPVKEKYQNGDTITVVGRAKSYTGMPVQGAKVAYSVNRRQVQWYHWYRSSHPQALLAENEATTDEKGEFKIQVAMDLPEWDSDEDNITKDEYNRITRFYSFDIHAKVTDQGGETHEGSMGIPLGSKPTTFVCDIVELSEKDKLKNFSFVLKNAAGQEIDGRVNYTIDGKSQPETKANQMININGNALEAGRHAIKAICGSDTIQVEFVVFSIQDKKPCIETHDWFYQTEKEFPSDGSPVLVQVGSSDADTHILYTVISENRLLESGILDLSNAIQTRRFTYKEEYGSGVLLTYAWVKNGICYTHQTTISRKLPNKNLKMKWVTFRDRLTPGQKEEWTLNVQTPDGQPAAAQLLATMYDKSLDQLKKHWWGFSTGIYQQLPYTEWSHPSIPSLNFYGNGTYRHLSVSDLTFSHFDNTVLSLYGYNYGYGRHRNRGMVEAMPMMMMAKEKFALDETVYGIAKKSAGSTYQKQEETGTVADANTENQPSSQKTEIQLRENLNETAFYYPDLTTDEKGNAILRFTLPESVTTWQFKGFAHDKDMNYGFIDGTTVAKKEIMVQPNMPRFVRMGDRAIISTRIFNASETDLAGTATLQLIDPETEEVVSTQSKEFAVAANETGNVAFNCMPDGAYNLLVCKIMASANGFSDGEQHYLPILPNSELITNTLPFTQHEPGIKTVDLTKLFPNTAKQRKLTVEYTNNPAWLMVQALPFVGNANEENAISLAAAYYANSIGAYLLKQSDNIKDVFKLWQMEKGNEASLMSHLQKNQDLKNLVLEETPWIMEAENESDLKKALANFFDENTLVSKQTSILLGMAKLQNSNGSFSWWKGMKGSPGMTAEVMEFLTRLNLLTGNDPRTTDMLSRANQYLSKIVIEEVKQMKADLKKGRKIYIHHNHALQWIYLNAISGRTLNAKEKGAADFLMNYLEKQKKSQSLYDKAMMATIFHKNGQAAKAKQYAQSLKEYTVFTEEMGRYYDTPRAGYSWYDYRIPIQVAAIEALKEILPQSDLTVIEMQRWLLQEKRTQSWDTPINSVNAVYAFLNGRAHLLTHQEQTKLAIDGNRLGMPQATAGIGYVKTSLNVDGNLSSNKVGLKALTAEKTSEGTSWGTIYAQFMQNTAEVTNHSAGLAVTREILPANRNEKADAAWLTQLKVGDKIKVRLTIQADRDYDFVQLVDKRAACLEPVSPLSGYLWGYYCSPKDYTTNYYFDRLPKGKHVVETEYYTDRAGTYQTGLCTVQCAYSPEYSARAASVTLTVK